MITLGESGLLDKGIAIRIGSFLVQTPQGAWLGLGTQPCYEAPGDLQLEIVENAVSNRLSPQEWPKFGCGTAK